ncbi:flavin prenyltransferase UbiX [Thiolapillus brandeum]|uniref:Flavin prenyltransferase UbiX n=1 Tax=Thiolapillus brandeum TaxID=1076588 RepID=A0A7U6JGU8_9GAMM|nr:flavin prenyltransferase UbiX [Thiolapillus brandeum]BAO43148.1 3-octaprenyl-4-hydroxybenzoate carboxy-lyase [Thiolapillus brandeum]
MRARPIAVALTGASGIAYGLRLVACLLEAGRDVQLLYSQAAQVVARMEMDLELPSSAEQAGRVLAEHFHVPPERLQVYGRQQWTAPVASGSNPPDALVVCPCTTGTLASIAHGISDDLIDRAADVMLKERRKLILVVRETPFSAIHLENMLTVTRAGGLIMPANPGFYYQPEKVEELVDFVVARILDHLGVPHDLLPRWGTGQA